MSTKFTVSRNYQMFVKFVTPRTKMFISAKQLVKETMIMNETVLVIFVGKNTQEKSNYANTL